MGGNCGSGKQRFQMRSAREERFLTFVRNDGQREEEERFLTSAGRRIRRSECGRKSRPAPFDMTVGPGHARIGPARCRILLFYSAARIGDYAGLRRPPITHSFPPLTLLTPLPAPPFPL